MTCELAVVIPTFNERDNVRPMVAALEKALAGLTWEAVFVDDNSPDGTCAEVRAIAAADPRIRCIRRVGRRGLSTACIEGMLATSAPYVAVIDADMQHDETLLPALLAAVRDEGLDMAVGSRYVKDGSVGDWSARRQAISRFSNWLSRTVLKAKVADPMSGFFLLRREFLEEVAPRLSGLGFKILVDLLASARRPVAVRELPYRFRNRHAGESKLDSVVAWEYLMLLLDKSLGRVLPVKFLGFVLNGLVGLALHLSILAALFLGAGTSFIVAQAVATAVAMTNNFLLNNLLTYRDRRLRGRKVLWGLGGFYLACGIGAVTNVQVAEFLHEHSITWAVAGLLGAVVGSVWNYAVTSTLVWRQPR